MATKRVEARRQDAHRQALAAHLRLAYQQIIAGDYRGATSELEHARDRLRRLTRD